VCDVIEKNLRVRIERLDFQMDFQVQFDEPFAHCVFFGSRLSRASLLSLDIPLKDGVFLPFEFGHLLSQHVIPFLNNQEKLMVSLDLAESKCEAVVVVKFESKSFDRHKIALLSSCLSVMPLVLMFIARNYTGYRPNS